MKIRYLTLSLALAAAVCAHSQAQTVNASQQIVLQGLRSASAHGSFLAAAYAPDGSLFLLLDQHDGLCVLKTDATATTVLAQVQSGSAGDSGVAMSIDPSGNIYITGTSTSSILTGTTGSAFPSRADTSTNSFLAKYDKNLNPVFLSFLGAGRTAAASVTATSDAVFVTGTTFSAAFPVTPAGIQQSPATGSSENGFVQRFTTDGSSLVYATYLTGAKGNTIPTAIVADASDNVYIAGSTSASGFPTVSALQPTILGTSSGFLTSLNPSGSTFIFSTFLAGNGINSLALDHVTSSLLLTGNIALGQFPIATVTTPLTSASYQSFLRISLAGQSLISSVLLVPGSQSFVAAAPDGSAWVSGSLTTPLFPGTTAPDYTAGDSFLLHLTAANTFDQTLRFGGIAVDNASYASLTSMVASPAINALSSIVMLPGTLTATVSASLLATQRFDLPLIAAPNSVLPNPFRDIVPTSAVCGTSSQCSGTAALLASISTAAQTTTSLSLSADDLPNLVLRNMGSNAANGLSLSASGFTLTSNCSAALLPSNQCDIALTGSGPGSITVSAANAATSTTALPANLLTPDAIVLNTGELDFGIVSSNNTASTQMITISNLSSNSQTFASAKDGGGTTSFTFTESSTDCATGSAAGLHVLPANSSCHITFGLTVSSSSTNDGAIRSAWKIGSRNVILTAFGQAAAFNLSATEIDFGTQFSGATALNLPRYLYLSNNSNAPLSHTAVSLPASSPFTVSDSCPSSLEPHSVCQLKLTYLSTVFPSVDAATLTLDAGSSVLLTGTTLPPASVIGSAANPGLSVSAASLSFATPVVVTGLSTSPLTLTLMNTGSSAFALTTAISGDFFLTSGCPTNLSAGTSCSLQVAFGPSQPGLRSGLLSLTAGNGFAPTYIALSGTGLEILSANNGTLNLGQTLIGEPIVAWYKVQQSLSSLTVVSGSAQFGLAIVQDTGSGHGTLPTSSFTQTSTGSCTNCWLGVQYLSQTATTQSTSLTVSTVAGANPYQLVLTATALPVQGLLLSPVAQDFGSVSINSSSAPVFFTLSNLLSNSAPVTVQSVTASGDFTLVANTSGGATCIGALTPTASCFVEVLFFPTATGDRTGTLSIATSGGVANSSLVGYGVADPGLAINPSTLVFTKIPGTAATQQSISLSNTGVETVAVGAPTISDPSFFVTSNCSSLTPGSLCSLTVNFIPQSTITTATLSFPVTLVRNGQTTTTVYTVAVSGTYTSLDAGLQILSSQVNFGSTATGALGPSRQFILNNLSGKALNVTFAVPRQFPLATVSSCATLSVGGSCSFSVSFLPVTGGVQTGSLFAQGSPTDGSSAVEALTYLLGYGVASGKLTISGETIPNTPLNFGQVTSGQIAQHILTLTNDGTASLTIRRITSQTPFLSTSTCGTTLAVRAACTITLTYAPSYEITSTSPTSIRNDAGVLTIESDAITSPDALSLAGSAAPVVSSNPASPAMLAAFQLSESSLTFPNTQTGNVSATQSVILTNIGTTTLRISSILTAPDFISNTTCTMVLPGAMCTLSIQFAPNTASTSTVRNGTLEILSDAGTSQEFITLVGTFSAAPLVFTPTALDFGTVSVGSVGTLSFLISNNTASPITLKAISASGDYSATRGTCPGNGSTLAAGSSCTINVFFTPVVTGVRAGVLSISSDATQLPLQVSLTGIAVMGQLTVSQGAITFGNITVGATSSLVLTLLNTGTAVITSITNTVFGSNPADFTVITPCSTTTLAPNQGCTETVAFTPMLGGPRSASLSIASSDPSGPSLIALTGTGVQAGSFVLTVNGASVATGTVKSGSPAVFPLLLTSQNGYTGAVALTCTPIAPVPYASCSLLASVLSLNGNQQTATATINTVTSATVTSLIGLSGLLLSPLMFFRRKRMYPRTAASLLLISSALGLVGVAGCGSGPTGGSPLRYTPPGTYQYQVTASSTSGAVASSSVTLNVVVQ